MAHAARTAKALLGPWQPPVDGDGRPFSLARASIQAARPFAEWGQGRADRIAVDELGP
jgi:hypothetical protein